MPSLHYDIEQLAYCAPDLRADGGFRNIRLTRDGVGIERAVSGVKMRLTVPIDFYRGVVLTCQDKFAQRLYQVILAHRDPDLSVTLHQGVETPAILAIWRNWARFFGKPALYGEEGGAGDFAGHKRAMRPRRRGTTLAKRRPRIFMRRRPVRLGHELKVFSPARELFSRE